MTVYVLWNRHSDGAVCGVTSLKELAERWKALEPHYHHVVVLELDSPRLVEGVNEQQPYPDRGHHL